MGPPTLSLRWTVAFSETLAQESPLHNAYGVFKLPFFDHLISGLSMKFSQMTDERLLAFYENVRHQVALYAGSRYRFAGDGVRAYADTLREEMDRRGLGFAPMDWPANGR